jgi:hypothetical protein
MNGLSSALDERRGSGHTTAARVLPQRRHLSWRCRSRSVIRPRLQAGLQLTLHRLVATDRLGHIAAGSCGLLILKPHPPLGGDTPGLPLADKTASAFWISFAVLQREPSNMASELLTTYASCVIQHRSESMTNRLDFLSADCQ